MKVSRFLSIAATAGALAAIPQALISSAVAEQIIIRKAAVLQADVVEATVEAVAEVVADEVVEVKAKFVVDELGAGDAAKPKDTETKAGAEASATTAATPGAPEADPEVIRLDLMDGSGISGKLSVKEISVETKFGTLKIPITEIKSFTPGLDSYPQLGGQVSGLIEKLGSEEFNEREQASKDLLKMGAQVRAELQAKMKDGNAERSQRIAKLLAEIEKLSEGDDEDAPKKNAWIRQDTIETNDFTVTGTISPKDFQMASKFGTLNIKLADIRRGHRATSVKEEIRKTVAVDGTNLAGKSFKSSGVRVEKGDKVFITADGTITMTPWGSDSVSTPDGGENYGWYTQGQIPGGALCAKIGDGGTVFKVGSKSTFTADRTGVLNLAIGMQNQYTRGSYSFPGKYDVKIRVEPNNNPK